MRRRRLGLLLGAWVLGGCGASMRDAEMRSNDRADLRRTHETVADAEPSQVGESAKLDDGPSQAPSRSAFFSLAHETRIIGAAPPAPASRPPHVRWIDLNLRQAKTADALQFLADSGGFNLVLQGDLAAPVTVSLHHVDPFDALEAIAETQHLNVEFRRGFVMVGNH